jgi:hypothetical protein
MLLLGDEAILLCIIHHQSTTFHIENEDMVTVLDRRRAFHIFLYLVWEEHLQDLLLPVSLGNLTITKHARAPNSSVDTVPSSSFTLVIMSPSCVE